MRELEEVTASARIVETWDSWAEMANAETLKLTPEQSEKAMLAYIQGTAPLVAPKTRKDIPDSFIYQQIRDLAERDIVTVITGDGQLGDALRQVHNVTMFGKLSDFLESQPVRQLFLIRTENEITRDPAIVVVFLRGNSGALNSCIIGEGGDKIVGVQLPFDEPSENPAEHTIGSFGAPTDIVLNFEGITYYGDGEYGLPFEFSSEVLIEFFIDKSEYWNLDTEDQPSVSDWNDYVFAAESEETVRVEGILRLSAPMEIFEQLVGGGGDFDITSFDISIDSIENVEVIS